MQVNRKLLFVNFGLVFLGLLTIEIASRVILENKYNRGFDSAIILPNKYFDSNGLQPNAKAMVWGKNFTTDNFGFRNTGKPFDKKKKTWLFIGDSVTQGVGVDDSSTYVALVAKQTDSVNVLNCSMIGWSAHDYNNLVKSLLADSANPLNISRITIGWCLNDVYGKSKTSELPKVGNKGFISIVSAFLQANYATYQLAKLYATQHSDHYFQYDINFYKKDNLYLKESCETLAHLQKLCTTQGVTASVLLLPYKSIQKNQAACNQLTALLKDCTTIQIDDTAFKSSFSAENYLFSDEIHLNALGHKTIAKLF
jgi:lysophospholipase L1-like esterase